MYNPACHRLNGFEVEQPRKAVGSYQLETLHRRVLSDVPSEVLWFKTNYSNVTHLIQGQESLSSRPCEDKPSVREPIVCNQPLPLLFAHHSRVCVRFESRHDVPVAMCPKEYYCTLINKV
jgi:hypothetical protein